MKTCVTVLSLSLQFMLPTGRDDRTCNVTTLSDLKQAVPSLNTVTMAAIGGCFVFWSALYMLLQIINGRCSKEWNCRLVTMLHGLVAANISLVSVLIIGPWPFDYIGQPNTIFHNMIMINSLGYFIFDFTWCVIMRTEGPLMLVHHSLSIYGFFHVLYHGYHGCEMVAVLGGSESTNPLLQFRWFVKELGFYRGWLQYAIDSCFVIIFASFRIICGTTFLIHYATDPHVTTFAKIGGFSFYLVSLLFMTDLLNFVYNKYGSSPSNELSNKGSNYKTQLVTLFYITSTVVLSILYIAVPYSVLYQTYHGHF